MPTAGAGAAWWQIDVLGFDEAFFGTQYLNDIFVVEQGQYDELGMLMMTAAFLSLILPVITVLLFNPSHHSAGKRLADFMKSLHHVHP